MDRESHREMSSGGGEGEWAVGKLFVGHRSRSVHHHRGNLQGHLLLRVQKLKDISRWISITAANGLPVPYIGYVECEVIVLGKIFNDTGFLVTRDPVDPDLR